MPATGAVPPANEPAASALAALPSLPGLPALASADAEAPQVEQELLDAYAAQGWRVPVAVVLSALLIVAMAWATAPLALSLGWLAAVVTVMTVRHRVQRWLRDARHLPVRRRMAYAAVLSAAGGITHGSSILFWPYLGGLERAFQSTYVLALSSGAVSAVVGYMPVFLAYMLPLLVPLTIHWMAALASPGDRWHRGSALVILLLFSIYGSFLVVLARDTYRRYVESFHSRQQLRLALQQAEAANRAKTRFLASASHDLRQPMHTLTLFGAALTMAPLDARARQIANQMNLALQALGSQLDALLDVSKLDAGVVPVQARAFALKPFLAQLVAEFEPVAQRKGLRLLLACPADACVSADTLLFERVLRNLVDNAIKYTAQGEVRLLVRPQAGGLQLVVSDTGLGIPADEQQRVFEEFYQVGNPERNRSQGLGLGLAIVKRLADLMQLQLLLRSAPGQGTQVSLLLPEAALPAPPPPAAPAPDLATPLAGRRLLVVDDEEQVRQGMQAVLGGLGCQVIAVADADEACAAATGLRPDAVLADLRLRGAADGIAAVARLRAMHPGLPALLISGDTAPERLREASAAGLRLLHKPVPLELLVQALRDELGLAGTG